MQATELFGTLNPQAPIELARFSFLIGKWHGQGKFKNQDGSTDPYEMIWIGRYILDGHAIADQAFIGQQDDYSAIFVTYRSFLVNENRWSIESFNVLESSLTAQAADDLGGVSFTDGKIELQTRTRDFIYRESYFDISEDGFCYQMDVTKDQGRSWIEGVDFIRASRLIE